MRAPREGNSKLSHLMTVTQFHVKNKKITLDFPNIESQPSWLAYNLKCNYTKLNERNELSYISFDVTYMYFVTSILY